MRIKIDDFGDGWFVLTMPCGGDKILITPLESHHKPFHLIENSHYIGNGSDTKHYLRRVLE